MGYSITNIDGDLAIGRNAEIGGDVDIHGKARVAGSLKIEGFLDAPNIKGVVKGLFATEEELKREYPNPRPGWCAIVLADDERGFLYLAKNREWEKQSEEAKPFDFIADSINVFASKGELQAEKTEREEVEEDIKEELDKTLKYTNTDFSHFEDDVELECWDSAHKKHYVTSIYAATTSTAGVMSAEDKRALDKVADDIEKKQTVVQVSWNNDTDPSNMNDFVVAGVYDIKGEHKRIDDNLPILNYNPGHTFNARLTVLDSSISGSGNNDDKCITQVLSFSNRLGQGEVYIRSGKGSSLGNLTWEKWSTLQRNVNVERVYTLDDLIDNGIYSGVYVKNVDAMETFVLVVINNYAVASQRGIPKSISQFKYSVDLGSSFAKYETRVGTGVDDWGDWKILNKGEIDSLANAISVNTAAITAERTRAIGQEGLLNTAIAEEKSRAEQAEQTIDLKLDEEIDRSVAADQDLLRSIDEETRRANEAEQTIKDKAVDADNLNFLTRANVVALNYKTIEGVGDEITIPAATAEKAGVMSAEDKKSLNKAIDDIATETTRAKVAEQANANAINAEVTRAKSAEKSNADDITAEITRAKAAEQANATAINAEATRAKAAEKANATAITEEAERVDAKIAKEKTALVNGDTVVGLTREVYSRQGKVDAATFLKRTTAGGTSISDGVASIRQIGGNIVKNLLGQINSIAVNVKYDISLANANVAITAKDNYIGNLSSSTYIGIKTGKYFSGHKYYIAANCYSDVERKVSVSLGCNGYGVSGSMFYFSTIGAGEWTYVSKLVELKVENPVPYFSIFPFGHVDEYIQAGALVFAGGINIIDLTEMFGAGKEPTKEDCDKMFATMGTMSQGLTVAQPLGLKSTGFNQWNPVNLFTGKTVADNAIVDGDNSIALFECLPCRVGAGENNGYVIGYGEGDDWSDAGIEVYLTPIYPMTGDGLLYAHKLEKDATTGTYVPKIKGYLLVVTPVTDKLCAHFLWSGDRAKTDYEEYIESAVSLPAIQQMSEWGLAGIAASGVLDTIDLENNKFTKRVGCIDLGSLTWEKMAATRFRTTDLDMKRVTNKIQLVCDKYTVLPTIYYKDTYTNNTALKDVIFPVSFDNDINIMTSVEYASVADFKAAVSGVKLYYELPAYEEYPITAKAAPNYIGSDYGVEQFEGSKIPLAANILFYMRSLVSETRNFLDRLMARLGISDATAAADKIADAIISATDANEVEPTEVTDV